MKTNTETLSELAARLGFSLESSAPKPGVDPAHSKEGRPWPHIAYDCTLSRNGRKVWSGPYKLGVGHVKTPPKFEHNQPNLERNEVYALNTLRAKPHATLADPALHASVAAKLADAQKVQPSLPDVLHSLISDGSAYFDFCAFEEWCADYGYDTDSRKAESIYHTCEEIGRKLSRAVNASELAELREAANEY